MHGPSQVFPRTGTERLRGVRTINLLVVLRDRQMFTKNSILQRHICLDKRQHFHYNGRTLLLAEQLGQSHTPEIINTYSIRAYNRRITVVLHDELLIWLGKGSVGGHAAHWRAFHTRFDMDLLSCSAVSRQAQACLSPSLTGDERF